MNPYDRFCKNPSKYTVYFGETMLASHSDGRIGLHLEPNYGDDPFAKYQAEPDDPVKGVRFLTLMVEIGDGQEVIDQVDKKAMAEEIQASVRASFGKRTTGGQIIQRAGIYCKDSHFQGYIRHLLTVMKPQEKRDMIDASRIPASVVRAGLEGFKDKEYAVLWAKHFIYYYCGIRSRTDLRTNKLAQESFLKLYQEYTTWRE